MALKIVSDGADDCLGLEQLLSDIIDDSTHIKSGVKTATVTWINGETRSYVLDTQRDKKKHNIRDILDSMDGTG